MGHTINNTVNVAIPVTLVEEIASKSTMPAIEGFIGILTRIVKEHGQAYPNAKGPIAPTASSHQESARWKTQRGFDLPVGLELFAHWNGHNLKARVTSTGIEYKGRTYEVSPSAAAAKKDHGASDTQASTNGWKFWQFKKPDGRTKFIDDFRRAI